MNILILAAGQTSEKTERDFPICLTEIDSIPLIQHVFKSCTALNPNNLAVIFRKEDIDAYHLKNIVFLLHQSVKIIGVHEEAQGAACSALLASEVMDNEHELLIVNGNEFLDMSFLEIVENFRSRKLDAGTVIFHSIHPRYSYVRTDEDGFVQEAAEKKPISLNATAGFYWYSKGSNFVRAAKSLIRKDARVGGNFYICPVFNELILEHKKIGVYSVESSLYHPLKNERQINQFETSIGRKVDP